MQNPTELPSNSTKPVRLWILVSGGAILLFGLFCLIYMGNFFRPGGFFGRSPLTVTPLTWMPAPSSTQLPTNTPYAPTPTPTYLGPPPLWMSLKATYTPTPLYVNTPHPINEAFWTGLRAYHAGDLDGFLRYMRQAAFVEPSAADVHYHVGQAYFLLGQYRDALSAYEKAIAADRSFAPAYLGKARSLLALGLSSEARAELDRALELDPRLLEARLERALHFIVQADPEFALLDLDLAAELSPHSPLVYLYRAKAYLLLGEYVAALQAARYAHELDITLLPAYLLLGDIHFRLGDYDQAIHSLITYTNYEEQVPEGWLLLGKALYENDQDTVMVLESLNRAIDLNASDYSAYIYRGSTYLRMGQGQSAVNDFNTARSIDPNSFEASLGLGRGLLLAGRTDEALRQVNASSNLAENDTQLAALYFWRAQILEASGKLTGAIRDYLALLALPEGSASETWIAQAQDRLMVLLATPGPDGIQPTSSP